MHNQLKQIDTKEVELPDTVFIRDIEGRVFQSIAIQCLADVEGIALIEGNFIDSLLGRESVERVKGLYVEQDLKNHSVSMKIELNIAYGVSIPEKAEEVQTKIAEEISRFTGLHVSCVHLVFKNLIPTKDLHNEEGEKASSKKMSSPPFPEGAEYGVEF